jgi:adenine-specific DNA-methyltransferase
MMALFRSEGSQTIQECYSPEANIVIYPGDCRDLIKNLPDGSIDLVVTSPPYNLGKDYEHSTGLDTYLGEQKEVLSALIRVLANTGSICWQVGNYVKDGEVYPLDVYFYPIFKSLDLRLRNRVIWRFQHGLHASKRFSGRYEVILWFSKSDSYVFNLDAVRVPSKYPGKRHFKGPKRGLPSGNPLGKNPSDIWDIIASDWDELVWDIPNVKANHPEKTSHPCQFPIELVERCVLALTLPGGRVLDPYFGVGSTVIAALKNGRRGLGAEKDPEYVRLARSRVSRFLSGNLPIRPLGKPVHQPSGNEKVSQTPPEWSKEHQGLFK